MCSNPIEALIFLIKLLLSNCLNWKICCDDHPSLSIIIVDDDNDVGRGRSNDCVNDYRHGDNSDDNDHVNRDDGMHVYLLSHIMHVRHFGRLEPLIIHCRHTGKFDTHDSWHQTSVNRLHNLTLTLNPTSTWLHIICHTSQAKIGSFCSHLHTTVFTARTNLDTKWQSWWCLL